MSTRYTPEELEAVRRASEEQRAALIADGECPDCGGDGEVMASVQMSHWEEPLWVKCPECGGSGKYTEFEEPPC